MDKIQNLSHLFIKKFKAEPKSVVLLPAAGGNRHYYRMEGDGMDCLGVVSDSRKDSKAFRQLSTLFWDEGINVPEIYAYDEGSDCYLEEDLGDVSLFSLLGREDVDGLLRKSLGHLVRMQNVSQDKLKECLAYSPFSLEQVMWDLNYFKYDFLKPAGAYFDEEALEKDFKKLSESLLSYYEEMPGFMFRDFQSRNVMVRNGEPWFIDYQGGRIGPVIYDAISFLWQAKANFSGHTRREMLDFYIEELSRTRGLTDEGREKVVKSVPEFVLFRTLQVLGAYGFRGLIEKRAHFIESIPFAIINLNECMSDSGLDETFPELGRISGWLVSNKRFRKEDADRLTVTVFSFSYKKGYPEDLSGNGGGFMFDCRGMHNPGRYEEYKKLTGRDKPVIDFLKEKGEADIFSEKAFDIVSPNVDRYLKRRFTNLQIGFGCTGGQHRSVYCAERVAHMISERYPAARVHIVHREQNIEEIISEGVEYAD